jgi:hypothetical protein
LTKLGEVKFVAANFANSTITIDADDLEKVKARIKKIELEVELEDIVKDKAIISKENLQKINELFSKQLSVFYC